MIATLLNNVTTLKASKHNAVEHRPIANDDRKCFAYWLDVGETVMPLTCQIHVEEEWYKTAADLHVTVGSSSLGVKSTISYLSSTRRCVLSPSTVNAEDYPVPLLKNRYD